MEKGNLKSLELSKNSVFCFGSNTAGRHGAGAAKVAMERFGAIYGQGYGLQGRSFGIPTKDRRLRVLSLYEIEKYIKRFKEFAQSNSELKFYITKIGTGLSGYSDDDIAPLFNNFPNNCIFDIGWSSHLGSTYKYFTETL